MHLGQYRGWAAYAPLGRLIAGVLEGEWFVIFGRLGRVGIGKFIGFTGSMRSREECAMRRLNILETVVIIFSSVIVSDVRIIGNLFLLNIRSYKALIAIKIVTIRSL